MQKKHFLTILLFIAFASCKDKRTPFTPENNPFKVYPAHAVQKVMLENFVGEANSESVESSYFIKDLEKKYGEQLFVCNLHKQDWLETPYSTDLATLLGGLSSYPRGAVNRQVGEHTVLNEDNFTLLKPVNWEYMMSASLQQSAKIALAVETNILPQNTGSIKLYIAHQEALPEDMRIGCYLIEDSIRSIFQQGASEQFTHRHVVKNSLFDIEGDTVNLSNESIEGEIISKEYQNIDLSIYHITTLYAVVFVFNYNKDFRKMKIYNAVKVKFGGIKFWNE